MKCAGAGCKHRELLPREVVSLQRGYGIEGDWCRDCALERLREPAPQKLIEPVTAALAAAISDEEPDWSTLDEAEIARLAGNGTYLPTYRWVNGKKYGPYFEFHWRWGKKKRKRYIGR